MDEEGKIILVGGGGSVGRVMAEAFNDANWQVFIFDKDEPGVKDTLASNPGIHGACGDISEPDIVEQAFGEALEKMGGVDVLVNAAHSGGPQKAVEELELDQWHRVIDVVLNGCYYAIKNVVPSMKAKGGGAIINFSTCSTRTALPFRAPYVAAKAGVEGLTRCMARELGPHNIRCNAILPGPINNDRLQQVMEERAAVRGTTADEEQEKLLKFVSLHRLFDMDEFAALVMFLASKNASGITGQIIELGGNVEWEE